MYITRYLMFHISVLQSLDEIDTFSLFEFTVRWGENDGGLYRMNTKHVTM